MNTFNNLEEKINNAKDLDFSGLFDNIIELFKKVWLKGFLVVLLIATTAFVASILFSLIGLAPKQNLFLDGFEFNEFLSFYSKTIIYSIPQTVIISTMSMAFVAAFYRICKQHVLGENVEDDYFYFLKKEYFSKLLMLGLIHTGITVVAQFLFVIPYIYVFVPLSYFIIVFAENPHFTEGEIVKVSFKLGNKKWLITFGTMFVAAIIGMLGVIGCFIGVLFTISIAYLPVFFIYKEVVGFDDNSQIDQIGVKDDSNY